MDYETCAALLAAIDGCTFAGLDTVTVPTLKGGKSNPMQGKIEKHCIGHRVILFTNKNVNGYLNKVKRHLAKEGKNPDSFVMGPLPWGKRVENSPFIENNGEFYLQACFLAAGSTEYRASDNFNYIHPVTNRPECYLKGALVSKSSIIGLNEKSGSEHQNLENEVIIRTYKLASIKALRAFHDELN